MTPLESTEASRARANGRWKLLRQALLSSSSSQSSSQDQSSLSSQHSIHRFPGYNLLPAKELTNEAKNRLDEDLTVFPRDATNESLEGNVESALLIRLALLDNVAAGSSSSRGFETTAVSFEFNIRDASGLDLDSLATMLKSRHSIDAVCDWAADDVDEDPGMLRIHIHGDSVAFSDYTIMEYPLVDINKSLLIRQKNHRRTKKLSLQELASHQFHDGIDNTGNVCIWDAETTLAWSLLQECANNTRRPLQTLTELGVGMAGLAALACAAVSRELEQVYLTDGHVDCVRNNQLNAHLFERTIPTRTRIHAMQLLWTIEEDVGNLRQPPSADWTLVSDCTHFQEYHAALFWTLVQCTKVNGTIWMCQPNRGNSWKRFCQLMKHVNRQASSSPLLTVPVEHRYTLLDDMHEQFFKQHDSHYDPNIHQPHVFCLVKLREATEEDRQEAIRHMETRAIVAHK